MSLGSRLKELRIKQGESLQAVADALDSSKAHIWELETGRSSNPSLDLLERLARHFKVPLAMLAGEPGDARVQMFGREIGEKLSDRDVELLRTLAEGLVEGKAPGGIDGDGESGGAARDRKSGEAREKDPRVEPRPRAPHPRR